MANIPVERTDSGTPWWLWLLGALVLLGLLWFLFSALGDDVEDEIADESVEVIDEPVASAFDLSDVYVTDVVGDNTFFVAPDAVSDERRLVYLEEEADPTDGVEGRYDVTEGQRLSITGSMEPTPADLSPWGLTAAQADRVGSEYIRATSLTVLDAAAGDVPPNDAVSADDVGLSALSGDLAALAGRPVQLDAVRVTALAGDSTFYVGDGDQRTLVVLESLGESAGGPGTGADGVFDVNVGDSVDLRGEIRAFARGMRGTSSLSEADAASAERRRYVVVINDDGDFSKR